MTKNFFETRIKPILTYIGAIGSVITSIAYIVTIIVLILGFDASKTWAESLTFSIISAIIGIIIIQFMKIQGITFASQIEENAAIMKQYHNTKTKDKKLHSIKYYWTISVIKDILLKGVSMAITTAGIIYIVIEGSQDWNMMLLAVVNLLMFICFGLLTLSNSYDFYNNKHIPFIKEVLKQNEEEKHKMERNMEMAKTKSLEQGDSNIYVNRRSDILDTSLGSINSSNYNKSLVLDSSNYSNCILGGTFNSSSTITDSFNIRIKENLSKNN